MRLKYFALIMVGFFIAASMLIYFFLGFTYHLNTSTSSPNIPLHNSTYSIKTFINDVCVRNLTLSDLRRLREVRFVDSIGKVQEGPLLKDVVTSMAGVSSFKYVIVEGEGSINLSSKVVMDENNYIILDYTKKNTVKLCGVENVLPRNKWVRDVTAIKVFR